MSLDDISQLLRAWSDGDQLALDELTPIVYAELHRLAHRYMRGERHGHSLQTTALVNEAYMRLVDYDRMQWQNRAHFFAVSAQLMRRILVDHARRHTRSFSPSGKTPTPTFRFWCKRRRSTPGCNSQFPDIRFACAFHQQTPRSGSTAPPRLHARSNELSGSGQSFRRSWRNCCTASRGRGSVRP